MKVVLIPTRHEYKEAGLNLNSPVTPGTPLVLQPEKVRDGEVITA